ncbi:MAG: Ig-like domain repeat protein [Candidatus Dormibacteria bacterium]
MCLVTVFATVAVLMPTTALAAGSPLESETFANNATAAGQWYLPAGNGGTNGACLTAGPVSATTSVPNCAGTPDTNGNGALRLTTNAGDAVGAVFYQASLPTNQGLDLSLDTYQFDGTGADGIVFALAAANPADPTPPASTGPLGGDLGYAANTQGSPGTAGMPYGYLGIALDVYGNFENTPLAGGSGCTNPSPLVNNKAYPESVTARGPGDGTVGYCILGTTATTYNQSDGGGSANGTVSNVGAGNTLDKQGNTTRTGDMVPVEMAINPSASATTTNSGLTVPAMSWIIAYTPLGTTTQATLTGALPTTSNNAALATFPASWINPATGIPYQLTFGFTASTGGSNEYHEINQLVATTLTGSVPDLALTKSDNESGKMLAGNHANFVLAPSVASSGGPEGDTLTVSDTVPTGMTPGTATSSADWSCGTVGQTVTCTYTPASAIAAGTSLPNITIPVTISSSLSGSVTNSARISSDDGLPAVASDTVNVSAFTATALPSPQAYTQTVTYTAALPSSATGSVTFSIGGTTLCTATLPTLSCTATTAPVGTDTVTATYSGDSNFASQVTTTTLTITKATPTFTEAAAPSSIVYGSQDTLSDSGLPAGATGTVTFSSGGSTLCVVTIPTASCLTAATLGAGTYPVTATYSGDGNYNSATATGASFTVTKAPTSMNEAAAPASIPYGTADTVSVSGLPAGATGTVTFTSGASTLCVATLPADSCATSTTLTPATYPVTATYSGNANYSGTTATGAAFTVTLSSTSMTESAAPASVPFGTSDTLSVSGLPGGATGTVTFKSGGSTLCVATLPATSCSTSTSLVPATYPVTATYSGDTNYVGTTASGASFTVVKANTSMSEAASPPSIGYGSQDTLSVTGLPAGATGVVTFKSGGSTLCTTTLPATSCQTATTLAPGTYPVTATYPGDSNYNGTTATGASFTVTRANPTFNESAAPSSVAYGTADTLSDNGLPGNATGTVTFTSGGSTLCVATLPATSCDTSSTLAPGTYPVTAAYSGDGNYNPATATGASFTVTKAATSMTDAAAPASIPYGTQDTVSVAGLPGDATGTVTFSSGGSPLCTATLPAISCQTSATLAPGTYPVTAVYSGDANYLGTTATGASFTVTKMDPAFTESAAPSSVPYGTADTVSAAGLPGDATGSVTFTSGGTTLCVATLPAISCQTSSTLDPALYPVTATYSGDSNYDPSVATGASFTVVQANTSMVESASPATIAFGAQDTLSVSGLPGDATGTVTFTSGGATLCVATLPATSCLTSTTLAPGSYPVTATYSGDANYNGSAVSGATFTVTKDTVDLTETAAPVSIVFGSTDTVAAFGIPAGATGTVTFTSGTTPLCVATLAATTCTTADTLTPATYPVTATYSGDVNDTPAVATGATFTVLKADTHMTVIVSPASVTTGSPVTVWVTGLPPGASGTVTFTSGGKVLCTATLPATSCTTNANFPPGTYPVTATYSGNVDYNGSNADGSGKDGVLDVVSAVSVPVTGGNPMGPKSVLGAVMVVFGAGMTFVARGRRRHSRKV